MLCGVNGVWRAVAVVPPIHTPPPCLLLRTQVDAAKRLVGIKLTTGDFPAAAPAAAVASESVAAAAAGGGEDGF